jgi:hypothetical protein
VLGIDENEGMLRKESEGGKQFKMVPGPDYTGQTYG